MGVDGAAVSSCPDCESVLYRTSRVEFKKWIVALKRCNTGPEKTSPTVFPIENYFVVMTLFSAESWWSAVAGGHEAKDGTLSVPTPWHMCNICRELAPVLFTHLDFSAEEDEFWTQATTTLAKITKITPVPDPRTNFQLFVLYLYTFRELLKPASVKDSLVYVNEFCPDPPGNFFVKEFLCAVCDPGVAIKTYFEMERSKLSLWMKWKQTDGMIERFFDLFVTSIMPDEDHLASVCLLVELLAEMIRENTELVIWEKLAVSLYKAIVGVMEIVNDERSVQLARCLLEVGETLVTKNPKQMEAFCSKLKVILVEDSQYRNCIMYWLCQKVEISNQTTLVTNLTRPHLFNTFMFELIEMVAPKLNVSALSLLLSHLAKTMIQKQIWMRLASKALVQIFTNPNCTDSHRRWFGQYLKGCFMFVRLAFEKKKAMDRVLAWVSVVCSDFQEFPWAQKVISRYLMLAVTPETKFLLCFLTGDKTETPSSQGWDEEYAIFLKHAKDTEFLPFKKQSTQLVRLKDKTKLEEAIDPEVEKLEISAEFKPFVMIRRGSDADAATKAIYALEDSADIERGRLKDVCDMIQEIDSQDSELLYQGKSCTRRPPVGRWLFWKARKLTRKILVRQKEIISGQIDTFMTFISLIRQKPEVKFRHTSLLKYFDLQLFNDAVIAQAQTKRTVVVAYLGVLDKAYEDPLKGRLIRREMKEALLALDQTLLFSPPSMVDQFVVHRIHLWLDKELVDASLSIIAQQPGALAIATFEGLTDIAGKKLKVKASSQVSVVLFHAFVRYFFDEVYPMNSSPLFGWGENDLSFLKKCQKCATVRVHALELKKNVFGQGHLQAVVRTVLKTKTDHFATLQYLTNPLDIVYELYVAVVGMRKAYSGGDSLDASDLGKLFFCTLVSAPPVNCLRIYQFMKQWSALITSPPMKDTLQMFMSAVERVLESPE